MHRAIWLTDLHLNFADEAAILAMEREIAASEPASLLIGGDIGEAFSVAKMLLYLRDAFACPIYFVLGNHDFYYGSIQSVRATVSHLAASHESLHYLSAASVPLRLTDDVALIGHDGWADAREGDYHASRVMMNDYRLIDELAQDTKQDRLAKLHHLGDESAKHIGKQLACALREFGKVILLTHVPPFRESCWYEGRISDDEWAPHFVCQAMGRAILDLAAVHPGKEITVLCGHTHSSGEYQPVDNVRVITGAAEYGTPRITQTFDLP